MLEIDGERDREKEIERERERERERSGTPCSRRDLMMMMYIYIYKMCSIFIELMKNVVKVALIAFLYLTFGDESTCFNVFSLVLGSVHFRLALS